MELVKAVAIAIVNFILNTVTAFITSPSLENLPTYTEVDSILTTGFTGSQDSMSTFTISDQSMHSSSLTNNQQFQSLTNGVKSVGGGFFSQFSYPGVFGDIVNLLGPDTAVNIIGDYFNGETSSLIDKYVSSSNGQQIISDKIPSIQMSSQQKSDLQDYVDNSGTIYDPSVDTTNSVESNAGGYANQACFEECLPYQGLNKSFDPMSLMQYMVSGTITNLNDMFLTLWNSVMKPIWVTLVGAINTVLKTIAPTTMVFPYIGSKITHFSVLAVGNLLIKFFQQLSSDTMDPTKDISAGVRTAKTLMYDYFSFATTTVYLTIINNQILPTFGDYFGFLSIDANYQAYWTAFSMAQHLLANELNIKTNYGKITFAIFGFLKIIWTYQYFKDLWSSYNSIVESWPESCKEGQRLFMIQIGLRAIIEFFQIIGNLVKSFKNVTGKLINYIGYFDIILTSLQLIIFITQI